MDANGPREAPINHPVRERPSFELGKVREVRIRDFLYRFIAGALTSIAAGGLTLAFGPRVGGIMLAFPAILAASLTLIEQQEDSAEAREDCRGAVIGGGALALFAAAGALGFEKLDPAAVLAIATGTWLAAALLGYALAWLR